MITGFFIGTLMNYFLTFYMLYFLAKVRFYPCILNEIGGNIKQWSYTIAFFCFLAIIMPFFPYRAMFLGFDYIVKIGIFFQISVLLFTYYLYHFHIKTTKK